MLTRTVRLQLLAFVLIAVLGVTYVAVRYVGVLRLVGATGYTVRVDLADGGGIFTNAEVTYRGAPVGRVGDMRLTASGISVDLDITSDRRIPEAVRAVVADRSVIGEQYIDLRPSRRAGPYLHNGSRIARSRTSIPPPVADLLLSGDQLVRSVPLSSLQTVVNQLYLATRNSGESGRRLISSSKTLLGTAVDYLPETISLISSASTVLATQNATAGEITSFAGSLRLIGEQLRRSDGDIDAILTRAAPAATEVTQLFSGIQGSARVLLANLLSVASVAQRQGSGIAQLLDTLPDAVSIGGSVITSAGINVGVVPTFFDPLPCTSGYGGTHMRSATDIAGNPALNTSASCTEPLSRGDVRGTQNAVTSTSTSTSGR